MINVSRFLCFFFSAERFFDGIDQHWDFRARGHDGLGWGGKNVPTNVLTHVIFMSSWGAGWGANHRSERALRSGYDATLAYVPCYGN